MKTKKRIINIKNPVTGEWEAIPTLQGDKGADGLTTSVKVNGTTYTHSNGLITLPNYPSLTGYATEEFVKSEIAKVDTTVDISSLPDYWLTYLESLHDKIETLQMENGADTFQFLWASDIHGVPGTSPSNTTYIGEIGRYMMNKYHIPFFTASGDIMSQSSHSNTDAIWNEYDKLNTMLSPIENEEFLAIRGNHDGAWGSPMEYNGNANQYYHSFIGHKALFNAFMRRQTLDSYRRVFGHDGSYFYVDYHNYRIYMLNTHTYGDDSVNTQGQAVYNGFKHPALGSKQLQWVADTLNTVKDNQEVIFIAHTPLNTEADQSVFSSMLNHYIGRSKGTATVALVNTYWGDDTEYGNTTINVDFTNAKGTILGWFNGHIHSDSINTSVYSMLPMFSITTAGGDVRDSYYSNGTLTRTKGTATETAIDLVTISSDYIYFTRIGSGYDRKYNRATKEVTIDTDSAYVPPTEEEGPLTQGEITSEVTWQENTRLSSSSGDYVEYDDVYSSSDIKVDNGDIIRIYGFTWDKGYRYVNSYNQSTLTKNVDIYNGTTQSTNYFDVNIGSDNVLEITIKRDDITHIRVCCYSATSPTIRVSRNATLNIDSDGDTTLTQGDITSEVGYTLDKRYSTSDGSLKDSVTSCLALDMIKVASGDVIRVKGLTYTENANDPVIAVYDKDKVFTVGVNICNTYIGEISNTGISFTFEDDLLTVTVDTSSSALRYIGICGIYTEPVVYKVTRNMELEEDTGGDTPTLINLIPTDTSGYQLNKKYSGNSIVDADGRYLTPVIPVDINSCSYLNVSGLKNGASAAKPFLYKVAFYTGSTITSVGYWSKWGDDNATPKSINLLDKGDYGQFDGIQLEICVSSSAITTNDIVTDGSIIATLSTTPTVIEVTFQENTRLSSSTGNYSTQSGIYASSDIEVKNGDVIRIYGMVWKDYPYIALYKSDNVYINLDDMSNTSSRPLASHMSWTKDEDNTLTITIISDTPKMLRFCAGGTTDISKVVVTRNM